MTKYAVDVKLEFTEYREAESEKEAIRQVKVSFKKDFNIALQEDEIEEVREVKE